MKIEDTFFHIPREATDGPSLKLKCFWITCMTLFSLYVTYTTIDIVNDYFKQKVVVSVEHGRFSTIPDLLVEVLPTWHYHAIAMKDENTDFAIIQQTLLNFQEFSPPTVVTRRFLDLNITAKNYAKFIKRILGWVWVQDVKVDGHSLFFESVFLPRDYTPVFRFAVSANDIRLRGDTADIQISLRLDCSWTRLVEKDKIPLHKVSITVVGDSSSHAFYFAEGTGVKRKVELSVTRLIRLRDCTTAHPPSEALQRRTCMVSKMSQYYNCCLCGEGLPEHCRDRASRCCEHDELDEETYIEALEYCTLAAKRVPKETACHRLVASWTMLNTEVKDGIIQKDAKNSSNCRYLWVNYEMLALDISVNRDYLCYREGYTITVANVFSAIGGVLGFFLGGSIVSVIQCGVIAYKQLVVCHKRGMTSRRRKRAVRDSVQTVATK